MRVADLIEILQSLPEEAELRIAYQPNYPLSSTLAGLKHVREEDDVIGTVYLCEGGDNQYASKTLWDDMEGAY